MLIFGIIGMVSFTEDIVAWKEQIIKLSLAYQKIVYYPFRALGISIHDRLVDYFFIGSLLGISVTRAIDYGMRNGLLKAKRTNILLVKVVYYILYLLFWPLGLIITLKQTLIGERNSIEREIKFKFLQWIGAALLIFFLVLTINTLFL